MSDKAQPTPGPWFTVQHFDGWTVQDREGGGGVMIAQNYADNDKRIGPNARLIAAAPDLLEALQRLAVQMQNLIMVCDVPERFAAGFNEGQRQADAAIAKATGA